jgi:uncharacterized repeat protein (TIGR03803 family)
MIGRIWEEGAMKEKRTTRPAALCVPSTFLVFAFLASSPARSQVLTPFPLSEGSSFYGTPVQGIDGSIYGTSYWGGGYGTVFRVTPSGVYSLLHQFNLANGRNPQAGLYHAVDGSFYGTTQYGGFFNLGTVYKITAGGTFTLLYSFGGTQRGGDGGVVDAPVVQGADGNFYGTTENGGSANLGTVYRMDGTGAVSILHSFVGTDGSRPMAGLVRTDTGNFLGTTWDGGAAGLGTVFQVTTNGTVTTLHSFAGTGFDGQHPQASLIKGGDGNYYGSTTGYQSGSYGGGTVFMITPSGSLTTLHTFPDHCDFADGPTAPLAKGTDGKLYGTTSAFSGHIFRIDLSGNYEVLHRFGKDVNEGCCNLGGLVQGSDGSFYGINEVSGPSIASGYFFRLSLPAGPIPTITGISPPTGASLGGTPVSISGTGFLAGATATIGGVPAAVTSVTPTEVQATTGPHAPATVEVAVTNPDSGSTALLCSYTYSCPSGSPTATVSGSATICAGNSTNLSVALTGTGPWTLSWADGFVQSGIGSNPATRSVSPSTTTTYSVSSVTDTKCVGFVSGSAKVTVTPPPSASIAAPASACSGATGLTASVPDAGAGATYAWSITNGTITGGASARTVTFTAGASGAVHLQATVTSGPCSPSSSVDIPIANRPTAAVSGGATICAGQSTPLSIVLTGTAPWALNWSDGFQQVGIVSNPATRNVNPVSTTTYTVTSVVDATACTGNSSGSAAITVNPSPNATITAPSSACPGATGLAASVPDAGSGATYAWTITNGAITSGAAARSITFNAGATGPVGLGVTVTKGGCTANGSASVTVFTAPTATLSGPPTACAGANTLLSVVLTGSGPWTIQWADGYVQNASSSPAVRNVSLSADASYSLTSVTGAGGCAGSVSGSVSISVKPMPTATVSGDASVCPGVPVKLRLDVTATGSWTANWSDGYVQTGSGSGTFLRDVAAVSTTVYQVLLITDAVCSTPGGGTAVVTVLGTPSTSIEMSAPVCAGAVGLAARVISPAPGASYVWQLVNGTITSGQGTPAITYTAGQAGPLTLSVSALGSTGCSQIGARATSVQPVPGLPVLTVPASTKTGTAGLFAQVAASFGSTYFWRLTGGEITSGDGTDRITFRAGAPGDLLVGVKERSSTGCLSPEATKTVIVEGITSDRLAPVAVHGPGAGGSFFTTELTLSNPGSAPMTADLTFVPSGGGGAPVTTRRTVPGGQQLFIPDVVGPPALASRAALAGDPYTSGSLRITLGNLQSQGFAYVGARTTTPSGNGNAGVSYAAPLVADLSDARVYVPGLRESATDRSNLALASAATTGSITLRVTLFSGARGDSGRSYVLPDPVILGPGEWTQLGSVLSRAGFTNGYALVERISGTEPFVAYGVVNDNVTNDGSWLGGIPSTRTPGLQVLPVLVETASFSSELVLTNPSTKAVAASLSFTESLAHPGGFSAGTITEPLLPGEQRIIPGAVGYLRGRGMPVGAEGRDISGTLLVTFSLDYVTVEGFAGVRTTSPAPTGGRYGVYSAALLPAATASKEAWVFGLRQDGTARSNLALLNARTNQGPVTLAFDVFDGETGLKVATSRPVTLGPGQWTQLNAVLRSYGLANGYVRVFRTAGTGPWAAYGVLNDGAVPGAGTGDGSFLAMTLAP